MTGQPAPAPPSPGQLVPHADGGLLIRAELLGVIGEDLRRQLDRAIGEYALLATGTTPAATVARARAEQWRVMHPGLAQLLDHLRGGAR